ncbi:MAG TPA: sigma-70 family RNA polymerase sigma factor [Planctomycetota bacterium]|nr:sigma-70 family RNA polymerase sigma factor [Planctomycetota bacterium]
MPSAQPRIVPEPAVTAEQRVTAFVRRHQAATWRFLRCLGCPNAEADELTQDALLLALRRDQFDVADAPASAFLRATARNLWLHRRRDDARRARRLLAAVEVRWQRDAAADGGSRWLDALQHCIDALQQRARTAIELFYHQQQSRAAVGRALGIGEHGARVLLQRVRAALRSCIEKRSNDEG